MSREYVPNFFDKLLGLKSLAENQRNRDMAKDYLRILKFVNDCSYTTYKNAKELVSYKMGKYSDARVAVMLNIEASTVRVHKTALSNSLYNIFGYDFFGLFDDYIENYSEIQSRLFIAENSTKGSKGLLPLDVLLLFKGQGNPSLEPPNNIFECQEELNFLVKHSYQTLNNELSKLNKTKLNYLINILDGKSGTMQERCKMLHLLEGNND